MIKLILIILLFLISLLAVFKAPAYFLWLLAIMVTEFWWVFAAAVILLLLAGFWVRSYQLTSALLGVAALLLYTSPVLRSYLVAATLEKDFTASFGNGSAIINLNDHQQPFSFFKQFSSTVKVAYRPLIYIKTADTSLSLDLYPAAAAGKRPCIIVVHGGSWSSGDSRQLPELNSYLAARGYHVAALNYRLAPKYKSPAPAEDVHHAISYLRGHADELRIDTSNFVLLGRSAGAQIALLAAYGKNERGVKGVIDFYGPADMVWGYANPSNPLIMNSRGVMEDYIGGPYKDMPQQYINASPVEFAGQAKVPTLIIHGTNDVLVSPEHSRRLNERLQQNGTRHFWLQLPWATHGFDYHLNGPGGQLSTYAVERFIKTVTR